MKKIPILNIDQFEEIHPLEDFYSNDIKSHLKNHVTHVDNKNNSAKQEQRDTNKVLKNE